MSIKTYLKLNDGNKMPTLGLGTWKSEPHKVGEAVKFAIVEAGYKHIDCAAIYGNEEEIGQVFKEVIGKNVKRENIFITSKLWNTEHDPKKVEKACKKTLSDLKLDYLDLYLMHWGVAFKSNKELEPKYKNGAVVTESIPIHDTWQAMEKLVKKGLVKSIGVCNFTAMMVVDLLTYAKIKPVVNQIELHPYNSQQELIKFCQSKGVAITAYSPLGNPGLEGRQGPSLLEEPIVKKLGKKYKKTPAQILINWALCRQTIVIPKSLHNSRILENIEVFDFELSDQEQQELALLNRNFRVVNPGAWWGIPYFL
jgi:diketogulonate reductase-like aldo/keto reductase